MAEYGWGLVASSRRCSSQSASPWVLWPFSEDCLTTRTKKEQKLKKYRHLGPNIQSLCTNLPSLTRMCGEGYSLLKKNKVITPFTPYPVNASMTDNFCKHWGHWGTISGGERLQDQALPLMVQSSDKHLCEFQPFPSSQHMGILKWNVPTTVQIQRLLIMGAIMYTGQTTKYHCISNAQYNSWCVDPDIFATCLMNE